MALSGLRRFLYYPERLPRDLPVPPYAGSAEEAWMTTDDGVTADVVADFVVSLALEGLRPRRRRHA